MKKNKKRNTQSNFSKLSIFQPNKFKFKNYLILNPDIEISNQKVFEIYNKAESSKNISVVAPSTVNKKGEIFSQAFPALVANPIDVTGAGDSLLAVMAIGLSVGENIFCTSAIACCQAALAVKSMGNVPIKLNDLKNEIIKIMDI